MLITMKNHQLTTNRNMSIVDQDTRPSQQIVVVGGDDDDMHLYWASGSIPSWRVQIALNEKEQHIGDDQRHLISLDRNEHKQLPIIDQNPRGQIPSLKIGQLVLNESLAICLHLENIRKDQGTNLLPDDPHLHAQVLQCVFDSLRLQKLASEDLIYYIWHTPSERLNRNVLQKRRETLISELIRWNDRFQARKEEVLYAIGQHLTLADLVLFPQVAFLVHCGYPIHLHPRLDSYYQHLRARPSIVQTFPPHWSTHTSEILADSPSN